MKLSSIVQGSLLLVIGSCAAFSPSSPVASRSVARTVSNNVAALRSGSNPLEVVDDESNAFEAYSVTDPNQGLATKDTVVGTGEAAKTGDVITVAYAGRLMSNGKQFDAGAGFSFKLGEGRVMPGWEQGISGMRVGGKRTLRIPPGLAYGERGASDVIPPNSHLEFDCELKGIASNPIEATLQQLNWQKERVITFALLLILLAASPTLPAFTIPNPF
uniref:peptidylprolyl isomerase n=1 Tax=Craspedostauros australis TaxID=1486917 RepID=A0A7R9WWY8_9STRA|mmetsp:Transcript_24557/g.68449  ORF Transcript_24557/g.68449 Transcript_24557/m.68449 type:complete len:217 (+) Transcript_24557:150-800(+)